MLAEINAKGALAAFKRFVINYQATKLNHELLATIYRSREHIALALALLGGLNAGVVFWYVPSLLMILWLGLMIVGECLIINAIRKLRLANSSPDYHEDAIVRYGLLEALHSSAWMAIILVPLFFPTAGKDIADQYSIMVFGISFIVLGMKAVVLSPLLPLLLIGCLPLAINIFVVMIVEYGSHHYPFIVALGIAILSLSYFVAIAIKKAAISKISYDEEKQNLLEGLDDAKQTSKLAQTRADEAERTKSQFLATMSHELRTPLNAIIGFSELMCLETFGPLNKVYQNYINSIYASGEQLLQLIDNLLDISRIEAGRYAIVEEEVSIYEVILNCCHSVALDAYEKSIAIHTRRSANLPALWVDKRSINQIILNLLSNAIKFTPKRGRIIIEVKNAPEGGQLLSVQDNGPGIPEQEIASVTETFSQGELAKKDLRHGTGIGLSIVKRLVELHGATMNIYSKPAEGTKVEVIFSRARVTSDNQRAKPKSHIVQNGEISPQDYRTRAVVGRLANITHKLGVSLADSQKLQ